MSLGSESLFGYSTPLFLETSSSLLNSKSFVLSSLLELVLARGRTCYHLGCGGLNSQARFSALPSGQCLYVMSSP